MKNKKAFTLLEILLVVAAIAILAGIVILAINPTKQLGDTRNSQRRIDVNTILNAVYQYAIDNNGTLPADVTTTAEQICKDNTVASTSCTWLGILTDSEKYLVSLPVDPSGAGAIGNGYTILQTANGRITVSAPAAEQSAVISVTR